MKKTLVASMLCVVALPVLLCGCGTAPLNNAPTNTANTVITGSALTYEYKDAEREQPYDHRYIYFANSYINSSSITRSTDAKLTALNRIELDADGDIVKDENNFPTQQETVIKKIVGSENNFMYSSGNNIFFASPSADIDPHTGKPHYEFNQYFKMKTDNSGFKCFYTSSAKVTQQTVLKIQNKEYLVLVDGTKLVVIDLETLSAKTLAQDFTSIIFANEYKTEGDQIAYYTKDVEASQTSSQTGQLLYAVDMITGKNIGGQDDDKKDLALNENATKSITLKKVFNGELYFTYSETSLPSKYAHCSATHFTYNNVISYLSNLSEFEIVIPDNNGNTITYVYVDDNNTYIKTTDKDEGKVLINNKIDIFFTSGDWVYFAYDDSTKGNGIYRISVLDKEIKTITTMPNIDYKKTNMSFDGQYLYFFAQNTDNTTGTFYMHRVHATVETPSTPELLSIVDEKDKPATETEN